MDVFLDTHVRAHGGDDEVKPGLHRAPAVAYHKEQAPSQMRIWEKLPRECNTCSAACRRTGA